MNLLSKAELQVTSLSGSRAVGGNQGCVCSFSRTDQSLTELAQYTWDAEEVEITAAVSLAVTRKGCPEYVMCKTVTGGGWRRLWGGQASGGAGTCRRRWDYDSSLEILQ
ncbi:hypothetical protein E2C01_051006 [Portunus trituberculatus]|uniref:Uncharacterized protein n=1 Tax=Portunus trituberculatus TaxID=210409 RepID=A0A5B7GIE3_PORTR|nr:hypothetical protein [Portunus trituberculatus]